MPEQTDLRPAACINSLPALVLAVLAWLGVTSGDLHGFQGQADEGPLQTTSQRSLSVGVRNSHLGYTVFHTGGVRYFATEILLTNQSETDLSMPLLSIVLMCDGVAYRPDIEHSKLSGYEFRVNGKSFRFKDLPKTDSIRLSAGASGSAWLVYPGLPKTPDIPPLAIRFSLEQERYELDVNAHHAELLDLTVERIGPSWRIGPADDQRNVELNQRGDAGRSVGRIGSGPGLPDRHAVRPAGTRCGRRHRQLAARAGERKPDRSQLPDLSINCGNDSLVPPRQDPDAWFLRSDLVAPASIRRGRRRSGARDRLRGAP